MAPPSRPVATRLWEKVRPSASGCWLWTGAVRDDGYGAIGVPPRGSVRRVHRVAYELLIAPIPEGLMLDHLCFTPLCVRPDHLEPVTAAENTRRWAAHRRAVA